MAAVLLLAACGVGGWLAVTRLGGPADESPSASESPSWAVGACVRQSGGPTEAPPSMSPELRAVYESRKEYSPVGCSDPAAESKVVALGASVSTGAKRPAEDGCPDDADAAYLVRGILADAGQVVCVRFLKAPHPGDPGGGGGKVVQSDCVVVFSSNSNRPANDRVVEEPCADTGWYAQVLAIATDAAGCTAADTLSRIPLPGRADTVLCLGPGASGVMPKPGQCMRVPANYYQPPVRVECDGAPATQRFEAFADASGKCAAGTRAMQATGYDRLLCARSVR